MGGVGFVEEKGGPVEIMKYDFDTFSESIIYILFVFFNENIATYLIVTAIQNWDSGRV